MSYQAFLDANVLLPARVRDVLLTLADAEFFSPLWSEGVLDEVRRHLPVSMSSDAVDALFGAMRRAFPDASITVPEALDLGLRPLVNHKDRHVVAAALWARSDVLVTEDAALRVEVEHIMDVQTPGLFAAYAIAVDPAGAAMALVNMANERWLGGAEAHDPVAMLSRIAAWMEHNGWHVAAPMILASHVVSVIEGISIEEDAERAGAD